MKDAGVEREGESFLDTASGEGDWSGGGRIRCPLCAWRPRQFDRWQCRCGHVWNTFDTAALCPGCGYQWSVTACLSCGQFSPHEDWYVDDPGEPR